MNTAIVPGTPRWAVFAAHAAAASVVPSALWRTTVGLGVPLGWSQEQLDLQRIPGAGTLYVITPSVSSLIAAGLTLGLVQRWGETIPPRIPGIGGQRIPVALVAVAAVSGALVVIAICVLSIVNWNLVSGFADDPYSGWALLMLACYLPALSWGPLLLGVTWAYWRRRTSAWEPTTITSSGG